MGEGQEALRLSRGLLPDEQRVLGPDHPDTLKTRYNIAYWVSLTGRPDGRAALLSDLVPDLERVFGPAHSETEAARQFLSWFSDRGR